MKIVLVQTAIGDYRQKVLDNLIHKFGIDFQIFAGRMYFKNTYKTRVKIDDSNFTYINNNFLLNDNLLFQSGMFSSVLDADVAILEFNPRIISVWLLLILRKILGKKTILWGHAWSRSGKNSKSDSIRNVMRTLADVVLVYTESQAVELKSRMPSKCIIAAPNSLYSVSDMSYSKDSDQIQNVIYVGRLSKDKKPDLLVEAFATFLDKIPEKCNLIIVGDGELKKTLDERIDALNLKSRIQLKGHINDLSILKEYYNSALVSVSPGYVGLSITQSFSFGVPMIISKDEPHAPEIEASIEGLNSLYFTTDSVEDLAKKILSILNDRNSWIEKRSIIVEACKKSYSAEIMASRIAEAITI